jgi:hypothetical protein
MFSLDKTSKIFWLTRLIRMEDIALRMQKRTILSLELQIQLLIIDILYQQFLSCPLTALATLEH